MKTKTSLIFAALLATTTLFAQNKPCAKQTQGMFQDGDTVVFFGDSITHGGYFIYNVYDYYLTRFPKAKIRFVNAGVGGDTAGGCHGRFKEDVADKKPTRVCVMFGMNDIDRGAYNFTRTDDEKARGARSLADYRKNLQRIITRLANEAGDPSVVFITPSPYDDRAVLPKSGWTNHFGCRDALGECADIVRELCAANKGALVDFYTPMTAYARMRQKTDPQFTLIGEDRVHPGEDGSLYMAWRFLRSQGADALVSDVTINASELVCAKSINADVSKLTRAADGTLSFTVLEKALPFPCKPSTWKFAAELPIAEELNQEVLSVTGLTNGTYTLFIDGTAVATHTAKEWSDGINLAMNEKTPQFKHAQAVHHQTRQCREIEVKMRNWASERWFFDHLIYHGQLKNKDDLKELQALADKWAKEKKYGYFEEMLPVYIQQWPTRQKVYDQLEKETQKLFDLRQPKPHTYVLKKQ